MVAKKQLTELKKLTAKRTALMAKVQNLDTQIHDLLAGLQAQQAAAKEAFPKPGSGPAKLCKVMSSRPKSKEQIAQKSGLSVATVAAYLSQYSCFESAGRGKGYIYKKPQAANASLK